MGCVGSNTNAPQWDKSHALSCGANKEIFDGTYQGKKVAVCVARTTTAVDYERIMHEIQILDKLKGHEHIINMLYHGTTNGRIYLVQERVEPIGYDLDRMVNQYSFTMKQVPAALMVRLMSQLVSALRHMHSCSLLHRDLKTENVLITREYNAKLIDMGIACEVGVASRLRADYLAPEICMGKRLDSAVDCWGLGLILHQVYQRKWKLVDCSADEVRMRPGMPSTKERMEPRLQEAMKGLLELKPSHRWTLDKFSKETLVEDAKPDEKNSTSWQKPIAESGSGSKYVSRFRIGKPPLTAFAAYISERHTHMVGRTLADLGLRSKFNAVVLLIDAGGGEFEKCPDPSTRVEARVWMYFGINSGDDNDIDGAIEGITAMISGATKSTNGEDLSRVVDGPCELLAFTLEFDCFTFPPHIPPKSKLGPAGLDIRKNFRINLAGTMKSGAVEPDWFPGPTAEVNPGDLGLVVRRPRRDGSTESTITDDDLNGLMVKALYQKRNGGA